MLIAAMMLAGLEVPDLDRAFADARASVAFAEAPARAIRARSLGARMAVTTDIDALASLCSAAARSGEPEMFLVRVAKAYGMTAREAEGLRSDCRAVAAILGRR